jgi:hypothetical protein
MVKIDGEKIRKKARSAYDRAARNVDEAKAEMRRFQEEDQPAYERWLNANFGALLTEMRELQMKISAAEFLIARVHREFFFGACSSYAEAFRRVQEEIAEEAKQSENPPEDKDGGGPGDGEEFDEEDFTFDIGGEEGGESAEDEAAEEEFWRNVRDKIGGKRGAAADGKDSARLKDLYRQLARRLHPDKFAEQSTKRMEWWHQTQDAYERGNVEKLEMILTLIDMDESGAKTASVSLLAKLTNEFKKSLRALKRQLAQFKQQPSWGFSVLQDKEPVRQETSTVLRFDRQRMQDALGRYEAMIEQWKNAAEPQKSRRKRSKSANETRQQELFYAVVDSQCEA